MKGPDAEERDGRDAEEREEREGRDSFVRTSGDAATKARGIQRTQSDQHKSDSPEGRGCFGTQPTQLHAAASSSRRQYTNDEVVTGTAAADAAPASPPQPPGADEPWRDGAAVSSPLPPAEAASPLRTVSPARLAMIERAHELKAKDRGNEDMLLTSTRSRTF
jgi:hypothetical protein